MNSRDTGSEVSVLLTVTGAEPMAVRYVCIIRVSFDVQGTQW